MNNQKKNKKSKFFFYDYEYKSQEMDPSVIYFQIYWNNEAFLLNVVGEDKKTPVIITSFGEYSAPVRNVLEELKKIREANFFEISWGMCSLDINLSKQKSLLPLLSYCDNVINEDEGKLTFENNVKKISVKASYSPDGFDVSLFLEEKKIKEAMFINDEYFISKKKIFHVNSVGSYFELLGSFFTNVKMDAVDKYFTLYYSFYPDIPIIFNEDIKIIKKGEFQLQPNLYIEAIDGFNNLHLQILFSVQGVDPFFITDYSPSVLARFDEVTKEIVISSIDSSMVNSEFEQFERLLKRYEKLLGEKSYRKEGNQYILSKKLAKEVLIKELGGLLSHYNLIGEEKLKEYDIVKIEPKLKFNFTSGIDFLEGAVYVHIGEEVFDLSDFLAQYEKHSYIVMKDNQRGIVNQDLIKRIQRILKVERSKVRMSFYDIPNLEELAGEDALKESFIVERDFFIGINKLKEKQIDLPPVSATLRSYQVDGYKWLKYLYDNSFGGCLADDMGLGKTIQTITLLLHVYKNEDRPSLLVVPKSLIYNWKNELDKFAPGLTYSIYHGTNRILEESLRSQIIITTYETVRNDISSLAKVTFAVGILDESQKIKNINSWTTKSINVLDLERRFALSGTPIENNSGEIYSLFRFLNPAMFGTKDDFFYRYELPIQETNDKSIIKELKKRISPFILRRLKKEVLKELPEKIEQELFVDMNDDHRAYYEKRRNYYYTMISAAGFALNTEQVCIFHALNELRQLASMPEMLNDKISRSKKRDNLLEQLYDVVSNGHKALVFTNYIGIIDRIAEDLDKCKIKYEKIIGATKNRQKIVDHFQNSHECKVLLMTLKTGGVGLNLTAADFVFIFDPWWNSAAEIQAVDRTHRIGQTQTVFSYKMITRGTIDEKILELQKKKNNLIDTLIDADNFNIKSLNIEELEFIFGK